jgi:Zn-dependent M28 family amino/carboxypeptidase
MKYRILFIVMLFFSINAIAQKLSKDVQNALNQIDSNEVKAHVLFLSDDLLKGRASGSYGEKVATRYIASQFEAYGLKPGAENGKSFFQNMKFTGIQMDHNMTLIATTNSKTEKFNYYTEFIGFCGTKETNISIKDAEVVFVGYGIEAPEYNWDDYKGVDVKGKILLMMNNDPSSDPKLFGGKTRLYYGRWDYKYEIAAKKGALGAIIIHTDESAGYGWKVIQSSWTNEGFDLSTSKLPKVKLNSWLTYDASKKFASLGGKNLDELMKSAEGRDFKPVPLGVKINLDMKATVREIETRNVIGVLEGSDKKLKEEAVVYTSHFDHLGVGEAVKGDSIYNGAFDNSTGVSSLITAAKAFNSLSVKPKRSVIFIATAGEEEGLLGSEYYVENPTMPLSKIAACLNVDAVNIFGDAKDVEVIGGEQSNLFDIVDGEAKKLNMYAAEDQSPEQGSFYRSDQFSFARVGVPSIYIGNGEDFEGKPKGWGHEVMNKWESDNYHQPSDQVEPWWDFNGMAKNVKLFFLIGDKIANDTNMPKWKPTSEFAKVKR